MFKVGVQPGLQVEQFLSRKLACGVDLVAIELYDQETPARKVFGALFTPLSSKPREFDKRSACRVRHNKRGLLGKPEELVIKLADVVDIFLWS